MSIDISIITSTSRIQNSNGDNGYGWVHLRPNQAFQYNDGVGTVEVATTTTTIEVKDGQLQAALTVHPTRNASHNPQTFYVVTYDIDGERWTEYFSLGTTPTSVEWGAVQRVVPGGSTTIEIIDQLLELDDPFPQYVRFDESTDAAPAPAAETARGESFLVRVAKATGQLARGFVGLASLPSITASRVVGRRSTGDGDAEELSVGGGLEVSTATLQIAARGVTAAKLFSVTASRLLGRGSAAGDGDAEELTVGGGVEFSGTQVRTSAFTGDVTKSAGGTLLTIASGAVTLAKIEDITAARVLGRSSSGDGQPQQLTVGGGLEVSASTLQIATTGVTTAKINNLAVVKEKLALGEITVNQLDVTDLSIAGTVGSGRSAISLGVSSGSYRPLSAYADGGHGTYPHSAQVRFEGFYRSGAGTWFALVNNIDAATQNYAYDIRFIDVT